MLKVQITYKTGAISLPSGCFTLVSCVERVQCRSQNKQSEYGLMFITSLQSITLPSAIAEKEEKTIFFIAFLYTLEWAASLYRNMACRNLSALFFGPDLAHLALSYFLLKDFNVLLNLTCSLEHTTYSSFWRTISLQFSTIEN